MKTLFLVRHSKAVTRRANLPDFQRTLVKAGEKKSTSMAKKLKKEGILPDLIISSTANRALETAHLFAKNLDYPTHEIMVKDALYNEMSSEALLYLVRQIEDKYKSVMLFGHNPVFTDFASFLVRGFDQNIPKTGIVGIQFQKDSWKDVSKGSGKVEFFEYPRRLAKTMRKMEEELRNDLNRATLDILEKIDNKSAKKLKKRVDKESSRIAKDFVAIMKATLIKEEKRVAAPEKSKTDMPKLEAKGLPKKTTSETTAKTTDKPTKRSAKATAKAVVKPIKGTSPKKPVKTRVAKPKTTPAARKTTPRIPAPAKTTPKQAVPKKAVKTQTAKLKAAPVPRKATPKKPALEKAASKKPVTTKTK